jgi:hypothetical protein
MGDIKHKWGFFVLSDTVEEMFEGGRMKAFPALGT